MAVQNFESFKTEALAAGYSEDEINSYWETKSAAPAAEEPTMSPEEQALAAGYTQEEIDSYKQSKQPTTEMVEQDPLSELTAGVAQDMTDTTVDSTPEQLEDAEAEAILSKYKNIYSRHSTTGKTIAGIFSDEYAASAQEDLNKLNQVLVRKLNEQGIKSFIGNDGDIYQQNEDGTSQKLETDFVDDMLNSAAETAGAIGGAIQGARVGAVHGARFGPAGAAVATAGGALLGGAIGAGTGASIDYLRNAWSVREELDASLAFDKVVDAGMADPVYAVLGGSIAKGIGGIAKGTAKVVGTAFKRFTTGNTQGAKEILLEDFNISKEQADEIVAGWERMGGDRVTRTDLLGNERMLTPEEKTIQAVMETQPGGESLAKVIDDSNKLVQSINTRAKDIRKSAEEVARGASDDIGKDLRNNLDSYVKDVKGFYGQTKDLASDVIDYTDYRFDLDKLAIKPVLETLQSRTGDPRKLEQFTAVMNKIDGLEQSKRFSDLLELRQTVNDFSSKLKANDKFSQEGFKKVINSIDKEIKRVSDDYLTPEQSKTWISQFRKAKQEYSKMKRLEDNVLFKQLTKRGATEDQIARDLNNRILALDDTFVEVMEKLPKKYRDRAEGAVVKNLTNKYTVGDDAGIQAIHFPMLAEQLNKVNFSDKASKQYAKLINEMADVFKNDVNLQKVSGNISIPKFQSYLTTDPVVRAKYEVASTVFNQVKTLAPTKSAERLGLVKVASKLMENPLSVNTGDEFIKKLPKESKAQGKNLIDNLKQKWAQAGNKPQDVMKLYKASSLGELRKTNGGFGSGFYLTDKVGNPKVTEQGMKIIRQDIKRDELATIENISEVFGRTVNPSEIRKLKSLPMKLKNKGYKGIIHDGKAMLFEKP